MQARTIIASSALLSASLCLAQAKRTAIAPSGVTVIRDASSAHKVTASVSTRTASGDQASDFAQCTQSRTPCSLTTKLAVMIDGIPVFVSKSAFADLGDINTVSIEFQRTNIILVVRGGDASESYIAQLIFTNAKLRERRLYSGEHLSRPLETTTYNDVTD